MKSQKEIIKEIVMLNRSIEQLKKEKRDSIPDIVNAAIISVDMANYHARIKALEWVLNY